jgi:hypothetical protein
MKFSSKGAGTKVDRLLLCKINTSSYFPSIQDNLKAFENKSSILISL